MLEIQDDHFSYRRDEAKIAEEAALDRLYVLWTSVEAKQLGTEQAVLCYKRLSRVEWAFRSLKTVDLKIRPIYHRLTRRVKAHVFLCMLAYYGQWHMRQKLAPLLFDEDDRQAAAAVRRPPVRPAPGGRRQRKPRPIVCRGTACRACSICWRRSRAMEYLSQPGPMVVERWPSLAPANPGKEVRLSTHNIEFFARPESEPLLMQPQPTAIQARVFALLGFSP